MNKDRIEGSAFVLGEVRKNCHHSSWMPSIRKPITFLAVAQIGGLVYSCLLAGFIVKLTEDLFPPGSFSYFSRFYIMSHCGWMLLAVPVAWFFAAVKYNEIQRDFFRGNLWIYLSGGGLFVLIIGLSAWFTIAIFR